MKYPRIRRRRAVIPESKLGVYCYSSCETIGSGNETLADIRQHLRENPTHTVYRVHEVVTEWCVEHA